MGKHKFYFHEFMFGFKEISPCPSGKSLAAIRPARASKRGRNAIVTERWRGLRWTLAASARCKPCGRERWQRTAKSCGPGAATLASSCVEFFQRGHGGKKGRFPGESTKETVKTIARGKPGCSG